MILLISLTCVVAWMFDDNRKLKERVTRLEADAISTDSITAEVCESLRVRIVNLENNHG